MKGSIILSILSGALLFLSFPPAGLSFLSFFALIPLLIALKKTKSLLLSYILGLLNGVIFFSSLLFWVKAFHPVALPFTVLILSQYSGIFAFFYTFIDSRISKLDIFLPPLLWTSIEYLRSIGVLGFPWGALGYTQCENLPLIQISTLTGVFGISFLIVLINSILTRAILMRGVKMCGLILCLIFLGWYAYGYFIAPDFLGDEKIVVAAIQGNFLEDFSDHEEIMKKLSLLTQKASEHSSPQLIVWTETVVPFLTPSIKEELKEIARKCGGYLLFGSTHLEQKDRRETLLYNSAFLVSPVEGIVERYDKIRLVPFGEMLPAEGLLHPLRKWIPEIGDYAAGRRFTIFKLPRAHFGVLICFEDIFGDLTRRFVQRGAQFMVNITNDVWSESATSHYQHFNIARLRAVENRIPIVRAANSGVSAIIKPDGGVRKRLPIYRSGFLVSEISFKRGGGGTFYTKWGDLFSHLCCGITLLLLIISSIRYIRTIPIVFTSTSGGISS
jgi:apolipoprotein N-acyltransferase